MRRRIVATTLAALVMSTLTLVAPGSAQAGAGAYTSLSMSTAVYPSSGDCKYFTYSLRVSGVSSDTDWDTFVDFAGVASDYLYGTGSGRFYGELFLCPYIDGVGRGLLTADTSFERYDDDFNVDSWDDYATLAVSVKLPSVLSMNASPEPVRKGGTITVQGRLLTKDSYFDWVGYSGRTIKVELRTAGSTRWQTHSYVKTDSKGYYLKRITASKDVYFRTSWAGSSIRNAVTSKADYVDVR